jgi:hypothetical protein
LSKLKHEKDRAHREYEENIDKNLKNQELIEQLQLKLINSSKKMREME